MVYLSHQFVLPTFTVQPSFWEKMGMWPLTQKDWTSLMYTVDGLNPRYGSLFEIQQIKYSVSRFVPVLVSNL